MPGILFRFLQDPAGPVFHFGREIGVSLAPVPDGVRMDLKFPGGCRCGQAGFFQGCGKIDLVVEILAEFFGALPDFFRDGANAGLHFAEFRRTDPAGGRRGGDRKSGSQFGKEFSEAVGADPVVPGVVGEVGRVPGWILEEDDRGFVVGEGRLAGGVDVAGRVEGGIKLMRRGHD